MSLSFYTRLLGFRVRVIIDTLVKFKLYIKNRHMNEYRSFKIRYAIERQIE